MRLVSPICCFFFFALFALSHECQCKLSKLTIFADSFDALHVYAGQTATLSYTRKVRESRVDFRGWRVEKNGEVFGGLKKEPGSVYQCTDALLCIGVQAHSDLGGRRSSCPKKLHNARMCKR